MRLASLVLLCCLATSCFSMALEEAHDLLKENTAQDGAQNAALDSLEPNGNPEHAPEQGSDTSCTSKHGHCQEDSHHCTGSYQSGLCSGHATRRCCLPQHDPALDPLMTNGNSDKPLAPHMPPLPQEQDPNAQNTNPEEPVGKDENEDDDANRQNQELERAAQELAAKQVVGANLLNQEQQAAQELAEKQETRQSTGCTDIQLADCRQKCDERQCEFDNCILLPPSYRCNCINCPGQTSLPIDSYSKESSPQLNADDNGTSYVPNHEREGMDSEDTRGKHPPHPFPFKPYCKPRPIPSPHTCCNMRETRLNLHYKYASVSNNLDESITVLQAPTAWNSKAICSHRALLKVKFDKITPQHCPGHCQSYPACGRRMLKITMDLHPTQRSEGHRRMFNIGDSVSNDGYGGDGNHQQNDAELDGRNNSLLLYPSDLCPRREPFIFNNALAPNVNRIHLYIANDFVRVTNDQGCDLEMCWDGCSFALNGQPDASSGGPNEEIYIGINRQVRHTPSLSRSGWGVCRLALQWMCPWIEWPKGDCDIV